MIQLRNTILNWVENGHVRPADSRQAIELASASTSPQDWFSFASRLLLWLGVVAAGAGVIFFLAYNWAELGKVIKFGLVESLLIVAAILAFRSPENGPVRSGVLLLTALLVGALLALVGQTYQTGADPWQLFAYWALFIMPLVILSRSSVMWIVWFCLLNLSLALYLDAFRGMFGLLSSSVMLFWLGFVLNGLLQVLSEYMYCHPSRPYYLQLNNRHLTRICTIASGSAITWAGLYGIFDGGSDGAISIFGYLVWVAVSFWVYRIIRLDLVILAGLILSGIVFVTGLLIWMMIDTLESGAFFLVSLIIIGMSTAGGVWLKNLAELDRQEVDHE